MPLKKQDQETLTIEICKLLDRLAIIYQIPNYDMKVNSMLLAEWILETYKHEDYDLVRESLRNPVRLNDHTWRLTPDSISGWIDYTRNKKAEKALVEESRKRQEAEQPKHTFSPETEKMIQDFKNMLLDGVQLVPAMTEKEIIETGQLKPKAFKHPSTDIGYVKEWAERIRKNAEITYRERHPNCTDEEVKMFLDNL